MVVKTTWVGTVAVISLDNPPVNAGDLALRRALRDELLAVAAAPELDGVVIESAGRHFYAGSDIKEFDRPIEEPQLPALIAVVEAMPVRVVAAINGLALGGGLELALACDARVVDETAEIGFPEVTLGVIPGAGGTVRAARLIGPAAAIDVVATARRVGATEGLELGVFDEKVSSGSLREAAIRHTVGAKRRIRDLPPPAAADHEIDAAAQRAGRRARPAVAEAIAIIRRGLELEVDDALAEERAIFQQLRASDESANLRYLFFATRAAAGGRTAAFGAPIARVAVAGAGTMGSALARHMRDKGFDVTVFDSNAAALARLQGEEGIAATDSIARLADVDLVIDAVFEDMAVKQELLTALESVVRAETVIATNTSYLDIDEMGVGMRHPSRLAGLHFFNPADRNPLVEIVRTATSDERTIATLHAVAKRLGKTAIDARVGEGFVANRVYSDYRTQAEFLVEEGASPEQVDEAMRALGLPIGPFAVGDMSGLDIAWARRKRLAAFRDPRQRYVTIPDALCERGRFGRKAGAGWYHYPVGASRGEPDPVVAEIIEAARREKGIAAREIEPDEIQRRIIASMVCAAAVVVRDGIAARASDVDIAMTAGFAFPRWLGGPIRHFATFDEQDAVRALSEVYRSDPLTFSVAEPAAVSTEVPTIVDDLVKAVSDRYPARAAVKLYGSH